MTIHGNKGYVTVGGTEIKLQSFSFDVTAPGSDATAIGDADEVIISGAPKSRSGTFVFHKKASDPGQAAVTEGATVTLALYSNGNASGAQYDTGDAYIETIGRAQNRTDIVEVTASWRGTGPWTQETVI
ncbi:MAG: hypothetical protein JJ902_23340 [Roseibium sp.]|nr:hypothetical protein [Roseibium sp.]